MRLTRSWPVLRRSLSRPGTVGINSPGYQVLADPSITRHVTNRGCNFVPGGSSLCPSSTARIPSQPDRFPECPASRLAASRTGRSAATANRRLRTARKSCTGHKDCRKGRSSCTASRSWASRKLVQCCPGLRILAQQSAAARRCGRIRSSGSGRSVRTRLSRRLFPAEPV